MFLTKTDYGYVFLKSSYLLDIYMKIFTIEMLWYLRFASISSSLGGEGLHVIGKIK